MEARRDGRILPNAATAEKKAETEAEKRAKRVEKIKSRFKSKHTFRLPIANTPDTGHKPRYTYTAKRHNRGFPPDGKILPPASHEYGKAKRFHERIYGQSDPYWEKTVLEPSLQINALRRTGRIKLHEEMNDEDDRTWCQKKHHCMDTPAPIFKLPAFLEAWGGGGAKRKIEAMDGQKKGEQATK